MKTRKQNDPKKSSIIPKITPNFHSAERLVNLVGRRECFVGLSNYWFMSYIVYGVNILKTLKFNFLLFKHLKSYSFYVLKKLKEVVLTVIVGSTVYCVHCVLMLGLTTLSIICLQQSLNFAIPKHNLSHCTPQPMELITV